MEKEYPICTFYLKQLKKWDDDLGKTIIEMDKITDKVKELEAQLFNANEHYDHLHETYCNLVDFLAETLGTDSDTAFELFKNRIISK